MSVLYGPDGRPISSSMLKGVGNKKADAPKLGEAFGAWAGRDIQFVQLPGGGVVQFDLSKLTTQDFRGMRDHYQVNASLAVLSFMQHQSDWHIEHPDKKVADLCDATLREIWTPLNRSMSTANWAGYSPNVMDWDNDSENRSVVISKVKDLVPEESTVNWKTIEGWAPAGKIPPKFKIYDGIKSSATPGWPIPVENTFWYPMLMENGDYYGRKLLRPAFTSWFFSLLVHLFANRYYERFGEPVPIGRAPFDDEISRPDPNTGEYKTVIGNQYMLEMLQQLRSRSVVVLPNERTTNDTNGRPTFDYDIEYLESQMRGADFERYLTRLDEEISIGLFTPILLMRTADVGSYNLGVGHMQVYLWMLNAMNSDRAHYINNYILRRVVNFNVSPKAPNAKIVFRKMGNANAELLKDILTALIDKDEVRPDVRELGEMAGMTLKEIEQTLEEPTKPGEGDDKPPNENEDGATDRTRAAKEVRSTAHEIIERVRGQVVNAFREDTFGPELKISMGYKRKFEKALEADGYTDAVTRANFVYGKMDNWLLEVLPLGRREFSGPESFVSLFGRVLNVQIDGALSGSYN